MTDALDDPVGLRVDPWAFIEALRSNPRVSAVDLAQIEALHARFERVGGSFADRQPVMDALRLAFAYGAIVGGYTATLDPATMDVISKMHDSLAGQKSGKARGTRTRDRVERLAKEVLDGSSIASRAELARQVVDLWGNGAPDFRTIDRHLSGLKLP